MYRTSNGATLWARRYNGHTDDSDVGAAVAVTRDGKTLVVTGGSRGTGNKFDWVTYAYRASDGAGLWGRRYNGTGNSDDISSVIVASPDGKTVFVAGFSFGTGGNSDYVTNAYRVADGASVWGRRYNDPSNGADLPTAIAVSPDGSRVVTTGYSTGPGGNSDYVTFVYRASNGTDLWGRRYNGTGDGNDTPLGVAVSRDGTKVFVTGYSIVPGNTYDAVTLAYTAA